MLTKELKTKWIAALRSGEYTQCHGRLEVVEGDTVSNCCLGVLNRVLGVSNAQEVYAPLDQLLASGPVSTGSEIRAALASLNDHRCKSFAEIADFIEANVPDNSSFASHVTEVA
jgi:hypothetical protein